MKKKTPAYIVKLRFIGFLFMLPAGIMIIFTTAIPFFWNIYNSFFKWDGVGERKFVGFRNYIQVFTQRLSVQSIRNSVVIALVATAIAMVLGVLMALMIYKITRPEGAVCRFLFYGPSMLPMTVVGLLFTFIFASDTGLVNNILRAIGLGSLAQAWLAKKGLVLVTIGFVQGWRTAGAIMMMTYTAIIALPSDLFEEAKLEGASYIKQIHYIIFPLIRSTLVLSFSMMSMWAFKTYDIVVAMTDGGPGDLSMVAPLYILRTTFQNGNFGFGAAISVVYALIILAIIALIRKGLGGEAYEF